MELKNLKKKKECLMTVDKLAVFLSIPKSTIYNLTMKEAIPHYHVGKLLRFDRQAIKLWLAEGGCDGAGHERFIK